MNMNIEQYSVDIIDVERDGSCFFSSISYAMNQSLEMWKEYEFLREKMESYWDEYTKIHEPLSKVTSHLIRYICSKNIDQDMFETHCIEADDRINENESGVDKFKDIEDMKEKVLNGNVWGDHSIIRSFFKAFENRFSLVIFDKDYAGGVVFFQKEWTKNKDMYMCLQRENNHYRVMRLSYKDNKYNVCMTKKQIRHFKKVVNLRFPDRIKNDY